MLTKRYLSSTRNVPAIFAKIVEGVAPTRFTTQHLKDIGFGGSHDRPLIPLMKELGFLTDDGQPTQMYHDYRDPSKSRAIMAQALRNAYGDLFVINQHPGPGDRSAIHGKFKSAHNESDKMAELQTMTFYALLSLADLDGVSSSIPAAMPESGNGHKDLPQVDPPGTVIVERPAATLHYNIQIHLPATKDIEVFNAIFKSLKEHLVE